MVQSITSKSALSQPATSRIQEIQLWRPEIMYCITLRNKFDKTIVGWYDAQCRTSLLTKDEQSTSSIGSTLTWSLISSGACIRASLKILRFTAVQPTGLTCSSDAVAVLL